MKKIIAFNWKMNLPILSAWSAAIKSSTPPLLKKGRGRIELIVCPPFTHIEKIVGLLKKTGIKIGAQDVFWENPPAGGGAYTGEISPKMLKDLGVEYVIIGHSERRQYMGETDGMINKKIKASLSAGLKVILCVGETLSIRKKGKKAVENFIKKQLVADLKNSEFLIHNSKLRNHFIVAYEPIWAIGTGVACSPEDAAETIRFIKNFLNSKFSILNSYILYGGSVNSQNIKSFVELKEIGGALVGGASLKKDEIKKIIKLI
jgi:triosephosphate isomerase